MFPVTIVPSGERKNLPLALSWAEIFDVAESDRLPTITIVRY
jgi:hypothetical protein